MLGATGTLVWLARGTLWIVPAILLHGLVLDFIFCALHESVHRTAFRRRWLNDAVGWVAGAVVMLPLEYFRAFHYAHHRFTQDPKRDPELVVAKPATLGAYLWYVSGLPNWKTRLAMTLRHAITGRVAQPWVPAPKQARIVSEARLLWTLYAVIFLVSLLLRSDAALVYWILPAMAGQPFLRLYLLAEHMGCAESADMFENTRTTYTNRAMRLLAWNMPYHVEHHAYPSVPFHKLAAVNRLVRDRIKVSAPGYIAVHRGLVRDLGAGTDAPAKAAP
jgi:fatty acid desaturase